MMDHTGHGRTCATCVLYHPERPHKPCSLFGKCLDTEDCAGHIGDKPAKEDNHETDAETTA